MKSSIKFIAPLLFSGVLLFSTACHKEANDIVLKKGTCVNTVYIKSNGAKTTYEYDVTTNLLMKAVYTTADGKKDETIYEYDPVTRLLLRSVTLVIDKKKFETIYTYNTDKLLLSKKEMRWFDEAGNQTSYIEELHTYSGKNEIRFEIKDDGVTSELTEREYQNDNVTKEKYIMYGSGNTEIYSSIREIEYKNGKIHIEKFSSFDRTWSGPRDMIKYFYLSSGKIEKKEFYSPAGEVLLEVEKFSYHSNGKLKKRERRNAENTLLRYEDYDAYGNMVAEVRYSDFYGYLNFPKGKIAFESTYTLQYDEWGNILFAKIVTKDNVDFATQTFKDTPSITERSYSKEYSCKE